MITFDEALTRLIGLAAPLGMETVPLDAAHGRILAEPVVAALSSPGADVSTMDGYAVRDADLAALPADLRIVGEAFPGRGHDVPLPPASCVRIFTGAPLPPGADRVVMQEIVRREGTLALFGAPPGEARFVRAAGSDFRAGDRLLAAGVRLGPGQLIAAAAADAGALSVWRRPRVAVLATGDELAAPGSARDSPGAIPESVGIGVAALSRQWGGEPIGIRRVGDRLDLLEMAAGEALAAADLVVVTGGASVGEKDFARAMFDPHGLELVFAKVAVKPGKPTWLGSAGDRLVLGLPGNPTSALVTARLFLAPLLAGLTGGNPHHALGWRDAMLAGPVGPSGDRETFARGVGEDDAVRLLPNQDSGAQKALAQCNLLVRLSAGSPALAAGETVTVLDF